MDKYEGFIKYDKLVRDKVPEIIAASGARYRVHVAGDEEYGDRLIAKLSEELGEFLNDPCAAELADIQELINAIAKLKFGGVAEVWRVRRAKLEKCGGFEKRLILEWTDNR